MMKLDSAKNILEIACGAGKLIPMALDLKSPEANYFATDLSSNMIELA
jgi:ubiquinone/menaquinone biosynthesis C-methylase UbiE